MTVDLIRGFKKDKYDLAPAVAQQRFQLHRPGRCRFSMIESIRNVHAQTLCDTGEQGDQSALQLSAA